MDKVVNGLDVVISTAKPDESTEATEATKKKPRGFAAMDPAKQREIAGKGGRRSHALGVGHTWSSEEARNAGRIGGRNSNGGRGKSATRSK